MDVVGDEGGIVSLTHGCNWESRNCGSKAALLGSDKLLIVIDLVVLIAVGPPPCSKPSSSLMGPIVSPSH